MIEAGELLARPQPPAPRGALSCWDDVLASLEREVEASERLVDHVRNGLAPLDEEPTVDPWSAPEGLGPLTDELLVRAHALLARQAAATEALSKALDDVRASQRRTVRRLPGEYPGSGGSSSAYVDITT